MLFTCLLFLPVLTQAAVQFGQQQILGTVSSREVDENSGLGASRRHPGLLYGLNDHGDSNRLFVLDPKTGNLEATLTITGAANHDWEDLAVGTCGQGMEESCIYIADIGDSNHNGPRAVYKVVEPDVIQDGAVTVNDSYFFKWSEDDAESLMVDPEGELYIISKVHGGNARFAHLPSEGWNTTANSPLVLPDAGSTLLGLSNTHHNDPQGADLSPDGRSLLVKTEEGLIYYAFQEPSNYVWQLGSASSQSVSSYVRRHSGEAVAWDVNGTGFYTLPEGHHPVFNYYTFTEGGDAIG